MENNFGIWLYQKLKEKRMSQEDLANKMGITQNAVSKHITKGAMPRRSTLEKYAKALNMSIEEMNAEISGKSKVEEELAYYKKLTKDLRVDNERLSEIESMLEKILRKLE